MKTVCLHPQLEKKILDWFDNRTTPAVFLIGPPGVGKTTLAYRMFELKGLRISEFNASHTRSGACFKKTILPLLQNGGVIQHLETGVRGGLGVLLDEIDGRSTGEKGGLQTLLNYLREWKPSNPGTPVIFISNVIQPRTLQMISRYCLTLTVEAASEEAVKTLIQREVPTTWKSLGGDLRPLLRGESKLYEVQEDDYVAVPEGVLPLAKYCLYNQIDPYLTLTMDNIEFNLAGLVICENLPDRLEKQFGNSNEGWKWYCKLLKLIQESDYADFWAFFYQTWRLLGLSQDIKLNTLNLYLQKACPVSVDPPEEPLRYTPVLTKQSALFNAWKILCEVADSSGSNIRLAPYVLEMASNVEISTGTVTKKQEKQKKLASMKLEW
jgi:DNA polymerase III delta prime subunit